MSNRLFFILLILMCVSCSTIPPKKSGPPVLKGKIPVYTIRPGEVLKVQIPIENADDRYTLKCNGRLQISYVDDGLVHAYISETYFSKLKRYNCVYGGKKKQVVAKIKIRKRKFPRERLYVDKKRIDISNEDWERIKKERAVLKKVYATPVQRPLFNEPFVIPLNSKVTSYYGVKRIFNNKKKSQHLGIDYRAKIGVEIRSVNAGKVVFAGELFFSGKMVLIDHGAGIFINYGHLSKIIAEAGEYVPKGALLGLSGMTGRVSGPHLHWGLKVNGNWIDGNSLVKQSEGK